jgi:DnaJ-domain-containing protein 1
MEAYRVQREKVRPATVRSMTFAALDGWGSTSFVEQRKWMGGRGFEEQSTYEGSAYRATWLNDRGDRSDLQARDDAAQDSNAEEGRGEFSVAEQMSKMTRESACEILRVAKESSDLQLRAAYHRMVIAWHPDRQQQRSDMARAQATDRMVAINAAYRFLRVMQPTAQL